MLTLLLPAAVGSLMALVVVMVGRRLRPELAAPLIAIVEALAAGAILAAVAVVATAFLASASPLSATLGWCRDLLPHDEVPLVAGSAALAATAASLASVAVAERRRRAARRWPTAPTGERVEVLDVDEPVAFALAGRPNRIVVSSGMLELLTPSQQAALIAHEEAHLAGNHHRYLALATTASAAVPLLRPLTRAVRHATERAADEAAASQVGSRRVVADAIVAAALGAGTRTNRTAAMAEVATTARVAALLSPAPVRRHRMVTAATAAGAALTGLAATVVQLHHAGSFAAHLCPLPWAA